MSRHAKWMSKAGSGIGSRYNLGKILLPLRGWEYTPVCLLVRLQTGVGKNNDERAKVCSLSSNWNHEGDNSLESGSLGAKGLLRVKLQIILQ